MRKSLASFIDIIKAIEEKDISLNDAVMSRSDVLFAINEWFYKYEMPAGHKEDITFNDFRRLLFEDPESIQSIDRYRQLIKSLEQEEVYNREIGLDYSMYTVFAAVTNYLSRRIDDSKSSAPKEIQFQRAADKLVMFHV